MAAPTRKRPTLTGLCAWTLLEEVVRCWAAALLPDGPEEVSAIGDLHRGRVSQGGAEARRGVLLDSGTCEFRRGVVTRSGRRLACFSVAGRGVLQEASSDESGIERVRRRGIGAHLWIAAAPVRLLLPRESRAPRPHSHRVYEGRFGDGEVSWILEGQSTYDLFCLRPHLLRGECEIVLRALPHLRFVVS